MHGAGCRVQGSRCRVQGAGCKVQGAGCRAGGYVRAGCDGSGAEVERNLGVQHTGVLHGHTLQLLRGILLLPIHTLCFLDTLAAS